MLAISDQSLTSKTLAVIKFLRKNDLCNLY